MRQLKITQQVTRRDAESLNKYLTDISPIGLIDAQREAELAYRIRVHGDKQAMDELVKANLRFVVSVAKQYQGQGLSLQDLINEGNLGLIKAATRFDETKGFKFISYAVWWIRQHILQGISTQGRTVRLPQNKIATVVKIRNATSDLMQENERPPTIYELAEHLGVSVKEIELCISNTGAVPSLDAPLSSDSSSSPFIDIVPDSEGDHPDQLMDLMSMRQDIAEALKVCSPREQKILCMCYGIGTEHPHTLDEIAEHFDVTRERVRQIKDKAIRRLRRPMINNMLRSHLG
jgi:RNA polymerase primary sigma factor